MQGKSARSLTHDDEKEASSKSDGNEEKPVLKKELLSSSSSSKGPAAKGLSAADKIAEKRAGEHRQIGQRVCVCV